MSRYIDPDEPLSAGDRRYLQERNKHRQIRLHDARVGTLSPTGTQPSEGEPAGSGAVTTEPEKPAEPTATAEEREWVNSLDVEELKSELADAKQPTTGKKAELQERLLKVLAAQD